MNPEELKYNVSHEWVSISGDDDSRIAVVGITDFAVQQLTDLVFMALPEVGTKVKFGAEFGEVESVKAVSPLYSPIDGEIIEVHSELVDQLETLGTDPFGDGWIIKVRVAPDADLDQLLDYEAYQKQCAEA